ncbi:NAD(P)-binding domain-containing protein [Alkalicoccus luteus]|uniref:NAD(P)-binding domain-containing protein n=1 Tax=Alkalicoccus luteus TaxID=1237094 RepID=UPI003CCE1279
MKIGFIGLGIMGRPIVRNLMKSGYDTVVFDINTEAVNQLADEGAVAAEGPKQVAAACDILFTMLPNSEHVEEVVAAMLTEIRDGSTVVDLSSISPVMSRKLAMDLAAKSGEFIDAPVSGGEPKAIDGTLSIMAGGSESAFARVKPVIDCFASSLVLVGPSGAGTTTKLANQIIVNANIAALSEAVNLSQQAGLDIANVFEAIRGGLAGSAVMEAKVPLLIEQNLKAGGRIDINAKDLTNVVEAGESFGVPLPLTNQVLDMFTELIEDGHAQLDHAGLIKYYEKHTPGKEETS